MNIVSDEAVEAACAAINYPDQRAIDYDEIKIVLEAAAPHMLAGAWEEGCREGLRTNPGWDDQALESNPYRPNP